MKKQLIALGAFLVLALGALPSSAACGCGCGCQSQSYFPNLAAPCCAAPMATPCCPAARPCCPAAPCCPIVKPCCPAPCVQSCPCPAAPISPCYNKCNTCDDCCD